MNLVTGSSGHLGEGLVHTLRESGQKVVGLDITSSPFTRVEGSVADRACVRACMDGVKTVYHTATLHKPHVATHSMAEFVETNIHGTLVLLEEAVAAQVQSFVFTSTTSVFGDALRPPPDLPAAWVTEDVKPIPKNIYGVTKTAAEDLCHLFQRRHGLPCIVLRTSRFFPEEDDDKAKRQAFADGNAKANEFLFRRVDVEDVVSAHLRASEEAAAIGFGRYIISATTPFTAADLAQLRTDAPSVVQRLFPQYENIYRRNDWKMFPELDRVYVNEAARRALQWQPQYDFARVLADLQQGSDPRSPLAVAIGSKGYHAEVFSEGPYPVE
ncbi:MAG: NAD-dependent epimerase/dehydratase family protein [Candidatus Latescibacteria bacterium]|nr:NAD-dependent epimerase/dehydratase family protein [Candidatus Latescibacterota bacterium]